MGESKSDLKAAQEAIQAARLITGATEEQKAAIEIRGD